MTIEEAIAYFEDMNECTYGDVEPIQMAIKALEQQPILDKIRAEIIARHLKNIEHDDYSNGYSVALEEILSFIDKYKTESEVRNANSN